MAGHYTGLSEQNGHLNYLAVGTITQPVDDNVDVHVHLGWVPKGIIVSADPAGTEQLAIHTTHMTAGTSTSGIDGAATADMITLRDNWQVTTAEYYVQGGSSVQSAAGDDDYITGFSLGTAINGTNSDLIYYIAFA